MPPRSTSFAPHELRTAKALLTYRGETMRSAAKAMAWDYSHVCRVLGGRDRVTRRFMRVFSIWTGIPEEQAFPEVLSEVTSQGGDAA